MSGLYGLVYLLIAPNNKCYVGQTTYTLGKRWIDHVSNAKTNKNGCRHLYRAISKHGPDSFEKQVLSVGNSKEALDNLEKVWIILLQTDNREYGYNLQGGGSGGLHSEESRQLIRQNNSGEKSARGFAGRKHSPETLAKMRACKLGDKNPFYGHTHTADWKQATSQRQLKAKT